MEPNFEDSIPFTPLNVSLAFIGFAVLFLLGTALQRKLRRRMLQQQGQIFGDSKNPSTVEERVVANAAWASGEIPSSGRRLVFGLWAAAGAWNLIVGTGFIKALLNPAIAVPQKVVVGIFALIGVAGAIFTARVTMRWYRFGRSWCCIDGKAGVLDQQMTGMIKTSVSIKPEQAFSVRLQCSESYSTGSGKNRRSHTEVHWQEEQSVSMDGKDSRKGIPFSFSLPRFPPESGDQLSRGKVDWIIDVKAPLEGIDYSASFVVPVFRVL